MVVIRRALSSDADAICAVHVAAIREVCGVSYTPSQVEAWAGSKRPSRYLEPIATKPFFVAMLDDELVGFANLDPQRAEVQALYIRPDQLRRGIGRQLLGELESCARELTLTRLGLKSSLNAVPFYQALGYVRSDTTSICVGLDIEVGCIQMFKQL